MLETNCCIRNLQLLAILCCAFLWLVVRRVSPRGGGKAQPDFEIAFKENKARHEPTGEAGVYNKVGCHLLVPFISGIC